MGANINKEWQAWPQGGPLVQFEVASLSSFVSQKNRVIFAVASAWGMLNNSPWSLERRQ